MCFSTIASFTAGTILSSTSIVAIRNAKTTGQKIIGLTPFFFGIQQLVEGCVWLSLKSDACISLNVPATYIFLIFAQVFWPTWVPLAVRALEKNRQRRQLLMYTAMIGMIASVFLLARIIFYPVHSQIDNHHILYTFDMPFRLSSFISLIYLVPVLLPPFISTTHKMPLLGILIVLSLVTTKLFYGIYALSVWCFFAALLSIALIYIIRQQVEEEERDEMKRLVF